LVNAVVAAAVVMVVAVVVPSYALWARRRLRRSPGVFRCRLRVVGPLGSGAWGRSRRTARWVHDVLLVHRGPTLRRCEVLAVAGVTGPTVGIDVRRLGERPVGLRLLLDDGRLYDLAVRNADNVVAAGPFVVASLAQELR
jgi:hypothetical protein